jgi:predicted permease
MLRSMLRLQAVDAGIRTERVISMRVALNFSKYTNGPSRAQFLSQLDERLHQIPGIRSVGGAGTFPLNDGGAFLSGVRIEGQPEVEAARLPRAEIQSASPGYFQTVGIPLLRGRVFDHRDIADREPVVVISDSMARQFFPSSDAVGARMSTDNGRTWLRIVGIVGDVRNTLSSAPSQTLYRSLAQAPLLTVMFLARTTGDPAGVVQQMRDAVHALDSHQPVDQFRTLDEVRAASLAAPRLTATLVGVFAGIALLITAAGLAGVIAFSVNQRAHEFGVRMALGASRESVLQLVLGQGLRLVAIGLLIGGAGALALASAVRTVLFETEPTDLPTFIAVAAILAIVALGACLMPARRAASVDPLVVLRGN